MVKHEKAVKILEFTWTCLLKHWTGPDHPDAELVDNPDAELERLLMLLILRLLDGRFTNHVSVNKVNKA